MDLDILESMREMDDDESTQSYEPLNRLDIDTVKFELELKIAKVEQRLQIIKGNNTALYGDISDVKNILGLMFIYTTVAFSLIYYIISK